MRKLSCLLLFSVLTIAANAADLPDGRLAYQHPPKAVADVLSSAPTPDLIVSPTGDRVVLVDYTRHPPISELAQPMLRLAGLRINPVVNGPHRRRYNTGLRLLTVEGAREMKIALPPNALPGTPRWSPDGKRLAFTNTVANGIELWIADASTAKANKVPGVVINAVMGAPLLWIDSRTLLVNTVPAKRGPVPPAPKAPAGPNVQESSGKPAPARTYQDLLQNPYDEVLFEYYATSQLAFVDVQTGRVTPVGKPAIFDSAEASPDGEHVLVARIVRPYTYLLPYPMFAKEVEVWSRTGIVERKIASLPVEDHVPIEGVPVGPREWEWRSDAPATVVWAEALDEGNPKKKVPHRDRVMTLSAPFKGEPTEFSKVEHRYAGLTYGEKGFALLRDYDRDRRWVRVFAVNLDQRGAAPKLIWSRSIRDRYADAGTPVMRTLPNGHEVVQQHGNSIFLVGAGASDKGDLPFVDSFDLVTLKSERLFRSAEQTYEEPVALVTADGSKFITRYETPSDPPNFFVRKAGSSDKVALTKFTDPAAHLRGIKKQLVRYKRADGVDLSFTLYLPPDYKEGQRLPTIVWAYPLEYNDASTAGQVSGSQFRFTLPAGISHLFLLTQGYAILDNTTMPVIGDPETMNNTYVEQIVASAKAAIDKAVEMGVTDPNRVGVGGHSYGAFMTANLLAHSDLFKAGVARSGAYNRTLTPFGFQSERRTFWEAPDMYMKVSPFAHANKINEPVLLIHGEADDNSGTFPVQSERMYQALKGNGATVRYVTLPHEAHGYIARESVEHTLWEMIQWFDKWVKNAPAASHSGAAK